LGLCPPDFFARRIGVAIGVFFLHFQNGHLTSFFLMVFMGLSFPFGPRREENALAPQPGLLVPCVMVNLAAPLRGKSPNLCSCFPKLSPLNSNESSLRVGVPCGRRGASVRFSPLQGFSLTPLNPPPQEVGPLTPSTSPLWLGPSHQFPHALNFISFCGAFPELDSPFSVFLSVFQLAGCFQALVVL